MDYELIEELYDPSQISEEVYESQTSPGPGSRWKKLENALKFINTTRRMSRESKVKYFEWRKRSKWVLLRNVFSAVNFFVRSSLRKLEIQKLDSSVSEFDKENKEAIDSIEERVDGIKVNKSRRTSMQQWANIRNALHWIR